MFQQITFLCLSALLNAAYEHDSPAWVVYRKNLIGPNLHSSRRANQGVQAPSSEAQPQDHAESYGQLLPGTRHIENMQGHVVNIFNVPKQRRAEVNSRERNFLAKYSGWGLLKDLAGSLRNRVKNAIDKTAKVATGLVKGSLKLATGVVKKSTKVTKNIIHNTVDLTKETLNWLTATSVKIGKTLVEAPLQGIELTVNTAWAVHVLGVGLTAQIISDTADWFQGNWEAVKAMEFPGKNLIVLLYPSGLVSVVDKITREIMYMLDQAHKMITHGFAYTLYISLKIVFNSVDAVLNNIKLGCVKLIQQTIRVDEKLIDTISTKGGKFCGISHLKPVNNVTITRNDKKFLIVKTPWVIDDLSINMTGVKVTGLGKIGTIINNEVMITNIKRIKATGTVSFEAGTLLRFIGIHLQVDSIEGLNVVFPTNKKSGWMESIEGLSERLSFLVTEEINHVLSKIEKQVFDYIANIR